MASELTVEWLGPEPSRFLWPDPAEGPFVVRLHWASINGEGRLVGVDLRSVETDNRGSPPQPVNRIAPNLSSTGEELPARSVQPVEDEFERITIKQWRAFGFRTVEQHRAALLDREQTLAAWDKETPDERRATQLHSDLAVPALKRRPGRGPALSVAHYAAVAEAVLKAQAAGNRHTLKAIQNAFGGEERVSRDMANHWRKRAQELGFLPPPIPRRRATTR